jgi:hypothetical protein
MEISPHHSGTDSRLQARRAQVTQQLSKHKEQMEIVWSIVAVERVVE